MSTRKTSGTRAGAVARARAYVEDGTFEAELARRVAFKTESQKLPASLPELHRYLDEDMTPAFESWVSRPASTTIRCRTKARCCSRPTWKMQACQRCSATATATSSAASRTNGPRAKVHG